MKKWLLLPLLTTAVACKSTGNGSAVKVLDGAPATSGNAVTRSTVGIHITNGKGKTSLCTGTLIDLTHVLTAVHCFDPFYVGDVTKADVFFGLADGAPTNVTIAVTSWALHPEYDHHQVIDAGFVDADVNVLTLSAAAPAGFVPAEMLQPKDVINVGDALIIAGYGFTDEDDPGSNGKLNQGPVHATSFRPWIPQLTTNRFGPRQDDAVTCHGDSGGPLYLQAGNAVKLVGVTKGGDGMQCHKGTHEYTDIRYLSDWIGRAMRGEDTARAGSVVPKGQAKNGQMYPYCKGNSQSSPDGLGSQPALGGKCLWPVYSN